MKPGIYLHNPSRTLATVTQGTTYKDQGEVRRALIVNGTLVDLSAFLDNYSFLEEETHATPQTENVHS